jgi:hypothetical protein
MPRTLLRRTVCVAAYLVSTALIIVVLLFVELVVIVRASGVPRS